MRSTEHLITATSNDRDVSTRNVVVLEDVSSNVAALEAVSDVHATLRPGGTHGMSVSSPERPTTLSARVRRRFARRSGRVRDR
jgi:predicted methyltransferase